MSETKPSTSDVINFFETYNKKRENVNNKNNMNEFAQTPAPDVEEALYPHEKHSWDYNIDDMIEMVDVLHGFQCEDIETLLIYNSQYREDQFRKKWLSRANAKGNHGGINPAFTFPTDQQTDMLDKFKEKDVHSRFLQSGFDLNKMQNIDMTLACQHLPSHLLACCLIFDDQPELNDISSLLSGDKKVHPMLRLYLQQRHICQAVTVLLRIMELAHMRVCPTSPDIPKILYFIQEGEWMNTIRDVVMYILMITSHENQDDNYHNHLSRHGLQYGGEPRNCKYMYDIDRTILVNNTIHLLGNLYYPRISKQEPKKCASTIDFTLPFIEKVPEEENPLNVSSNHDNSFDIEYAYHSYHYHRHTRSTYAHHFAYRDEYSEHVFPSIVRSIRTCLANFEKQYDMLFLSMQWRSLNGGSKGAESEVFDSIDPTTTLDIWDIIRTLQGTRCHFNMGLVVEAITKELQHSLPTKRKSFSHSYSDYSFIASLILCCHLDELLHKLSLMLDVREIYASIMYNNSNRESDGSDLLLLFNEMMALVQKYFSSREKVLSQKKCQKRWGPYNTSNKDASAVLGRDYRNCSRTLPYASDVLYSVVRMLITGVDCYSKLLRTFDGPCDADNNLWYSHLYDKSYTIRYPNFVNATTSTSSAKIIAYKIMSKLAQTVASTFRFSNHLSNFYYSKKNSSPSHVLCFDSQEICLHFYLIRCCYYLSEETFSRDLIMRSIVPAVKDYLLTERDQTKHFLRDDDNIKSGFEDYDLIWDAWAPFYRYNTDVISFLKTVKVLFFSKTLRIKEKTTLNSAQLKDKCLIVDKLPPLLPSIVEVMPGRVDTMMIIRLLSTLHYFNVETCQQTDKDKLIALIVESIDIGYRSTLEIENVLFNVGKHVRLKGSLYSKTFTEDMGKSAGGANDGGDGELIRDLFSKIYSRIKYEAKKNFKKKSQDKDRIHEP